jgi:hypothetical protein
MAATALPVCLSKKNPNILNIKNCAIISSSVCASCGCKTAVATLSHNEGVTMD